MREEGDGFIFFDRTGSGRIGRVRMILPPSVRQTLAMIADAMAVAEDDWWIIASAAVALHGVATTVADVDLLVSIGDARRVATTLGIVPAAGSPSDRFRSRLFARWAAPPLPVEVMAGFSIAVEGGWHAVVPTTRQCIMLDERAVYVPSRRELAALLRLCGRPKDLQRARLLDPDPAG